MELTKEKKIQKLTEAQEKLFDVIEAIEEGDDANVQGYLVDHLRKYASEDHGFLIGDPNLDELMKKIVEAEDSQRKIGKKKIVCKYSQCSKFRKDATHYCCDACSGDDYDYHRIYGKEGK